MYSAIKTEWLYLGAICLVAVIVILPIPLVGIPSGDDLSQHYHFALTYYDSLINGDGFPNWSAQENFGYGGIGIRFYPPLAYYVLAFARIVVGNWFDASWLTFMFWMILSALGVYYWARWWFSPRESALAAVFYTIIPYHLCQLYTFSFLYADFAAAAILPFCFGFLTRVLTRENKLDVLGFGIAYAALILTHLPTTITGSLCFGLYTIIFLKKETFRRQIVKASIGISLGLAASSFYWFRMVTEINWLNHATDRFSSGRYGFANGFFPAYFNSPIASVNSLAAFVTDIAFFISFLFLGSAVIYFFYLRRKSSQSDAAVNIFRTVFPLGLFSVFMTTSLSFPLWEILPPLQRIQFPWRWMSISSMCGSVVAVAVIHFLLKQNLFKQRIWIYAATIFAAAILLFNCIYIWHPDAFMPIPRDTFLSEMRELPEKESLNCWWAIWSDQKALETKEKIIAGNRPTTVDEWKPEEKIFTVASGNPTKIRVAVFDYPRWQATVNDLPAAIERDENGAMLIPVSAGKSTIRIYFAETSAYKFICAFSIIVWLLIISSGLFLSRRKIFVSKNTSSLFTEEKVLC